MVFKKTFKRLYNSKAGKSIRTATGNRYGRGAKEIISKGLPQLYKDVMMLKSTINAEKKFIDQVFSNNIAQLSANTSGFIIGEITPIPTEGITRSTRNGASIKLHSTHMQYQIIPQTSFKGPLKLKIMFIQVIGAPTTSYNPFVYNIFNNNAFVSPSIVDYNSTLNPDAFGTYRILRTFYTTVAPQTETGQIPIKTGTIGMKYNRGKGHHIRFAGDTNVLADGQIVMILLCDTGNSSSSASTSTGVATQTALTGITVQMATRHYYYDN